MEMKYDIGEQGMALEMLQEADDRLAKAAVSANKCRGYIIVDGKNRGALFSSHSHG
jgi:hypothetical protein